MGAMLDDMEKREENKNKVTTAEEMPALEEQQSLETVE